MKFKVALIIVILVIIGFFWFRPANKQHVQMNNETCPVSGNPAKKEHTYVHEGKEYNLCSEGCKQPLSENPENYLSE